MKGEKKQNYRAGFAGILLLAGLALTGVLWMGVEFQLGGTEQKETEEKADPPFEVGQIYLYGESHGQPPLLQEELETWGTYYQAGMRHLFEELPYYTAAFLNLWMEADDDEILEQLYQDWKGTAIHTQEVLEYYREIKEKYPDTIFHGTDVGHQFDTTGLRYLNYLEETGQTGSEAYRKTQEAIEQGRIFYQERDDVYRENQMTENFIQAFDSLNGEAVMGIYGNAHTNVHAKDYRTKTVPCMANQLAEHYGGILHTKDLVSLFQMDVREGGPERISVQGKAYEAVYLGKQDLTPFFEQYQFREYWRLSDAYEDLSHCPTTGDVLPYSQYPAEVKSGEVFVIDYTERDGSVTRHYYRSSGTLWEGFPTTEEFTVKG